MENPNNETKVGKEISLKGVVKAVFGDATHIQIGNKVIVIKNGDLGLNS